MCDNIISYLTQQKALLRLGNIAPADMKHLYERIETIDNTWRVLNQRHDLARAKTEQTSVRIDDETEDKDAHERSRFAQSVQDDEATQDNVTKAVMRLIPQHNVFRLTTYFATVFAANLVAYIFVWFMPDMNEDGAPVLHSLCLMFSTLCTLVMPLVACGWLCRETYKRLRKRNPKRYDLCFTIVVIVKWFLTITTLFKMLLFAYHLATSELRFLGCNFVFFPCVVFALFFITITNAVVVLFVEVCTSVFCQYLLVAPKVCCVWCSIIGLD